MSVMHVSVQLLVGVLLGDVVTSLTHWVEDTYMSIETATHPALKNIALENELHHMVPYAITTSHPLRNMEVTVVLASLAIAGLWILAPSLFTTSPWLLGSMWGTMTISNLVHRYLHDRPCRRPALITILQRAGIVVSSEDHTAHHRRGHGSYGVILAPTNTLLDTTGLFPGLEWVVETVLGVRPHPKAPFDAYKQTYPNLNPRPGDPCPDPPTQDQLDTLRRNIVVT